MKTIADCIDPGAGSTWSPRRSTDSPAVLDLRRCQFSSADGRRCRMPRWEAHPALCISHAHAYAKTESQSSAARNLAGELAPLSGEFRTATDVNHALGRLFTLLAQNRIPRRNAVALGYLAQLLLQTLPGVHDELIRCLGYDAWDETLESAFGVDQTEDETEAETEAETEDDTEANAEDEAEDDREASMGESGRAEATSERQPTMDEKKTVPALVVAAPAQTEAAHQAEIAPEPKPEELTEPEEFVPQPPEPWSYWRELERNEQLRKMRH